jgi:hypothetical protein
MSEHTPGPWHVGVERDGYTPINGDDWRGLALVVTSMEDDKSCAEGVANARRICAAVNACAGIPTAALEAAVRDGKFLHAYQMLLRKRDELLAALEPLSQWREVIAALPSFSAKGAMLEDFDYARAAIAKATCEVTQ